MSLQMLRLDYPPKKVMTIHSYPTLMVTVASLKLLERREFAKMGLFA